MGDEDACAGLAEDEGEALGRPGLVEGDVGRAGLEDGEQGDDEVRGAVEADSDARAGEDTEGAQVVGELVGARVELRVGDSLIPRDNGDCVGCTGHLLLEQRMHARAARIRPGCLVPRREHLLLLVSTQCRERAQRLLGPRDGRLEQHGEVAKQALHGGRFEQVGVVVEDAREPVSFIEQQAEVILRCVDFSGDRLEHQAREREGGLGCVLQREGDLEERGAAQVTLGLEFLDELLEGDILMLISRERVQAHLSQQLAEGLPAIDPGAEDERVDEEADEAFGLGAVAVGDGGADRDVVLSRVLGEQELEGSQQDHEGRGALALGQGLDGLSEFPRELDGEHGAAVGLNGGARLVGGQLERGSGARELLTPPVELGGEDVAVEPLALPDGEVGVLDGQGGELRGLSPGELTVEGCEFAQDDGNGPAVGRDVVNGDEQQMLRRGQADE
ncbi:hypothetical protein VZQ01_00400 [Myxococcus faecalis]